MKQAQRHQEILELLSQCGFATTEDLVAHFDVSPQTIRRDLNELAELEKIQRHHGGASLPSFGSVSGCAWKVAQQEEKSRMARAIASRIPDGASLFINTGSTAEAVARALLDHRDLRVITSSLNVASILTARDDFTVIIAGGEIRSADGGITGTAVRDFLGQFRVDFGITSVKAVDSAGTLLANDFHDAAVTQVLLSHSRCTFLATDHTKFGKGAMIKVADIGLIDVLFTDLPLAEEFGHLLELHHVECCLC
jgi:Transcriptional regulators of sugar metabolism